jgi:hypothetical protein
MTKDEELQISQQENRMLKALVTDLLMLKELLGQAQARIKELESLLVQDNLTSGKTLSFNKLASLLRSMLHQISKHPLGQAGHSGYTIAVRSV